jgi:alanyl-tRNA synthetase
MQQLSTDELRRAYLDFFVQKHGHAEIPGAPLVPENDPTVLFTTAGMHPLVPYLLGEKHPAGKRLCDVQRCVRTQDIDEVGDSSHLTLFEMLGNWSLGDYFKEGAIRMSYEFLMEVLQIPLEKFAVTCFEGDSDAPRDEESAGMEERGIGFEQVQKILTDNTPFKYIHEGIEKVGYYEEKTKVFVGQIKESKVITTVINNVKESYVNNLKKTVEK